LALVLASAGTLIVWTVPLYHVDESHMEGKAIVTTQYHLRASQMRARYTLLAVSVIPILGAFLALALKRLQKPIGWTLLVLSILAGMSIGLFYIPAALALLLPAKEP
jgi:hypothetical protein